MKEMKLDSTLSSENQVTDICKNPSQKLHVLAEAIRHIDVNKRKFLNYCPLVWMFQSRKLNNLIYKIHEMALQLIFDDIHSTFRNLLVKDSFIYDNLLKSKSTYTCYKNFCRSDDDRNV